MKKLTGAEIRKKFIEYFEKQKHTCVASSSLVPHDDQTLLFANAGMNQFKNVFLGLEKRPYTRAVSSQKCVRAGGKHNDLENVGHTARHHTFFEMLGNFSFGDYFKKESIHFGWEFLTKELGIPKERLYVTVFEKDDEAAEIWHKQEGLPKEKIFHFGEKDNFWRMGDTGPCGPCSEIFYDHTPEKGIVTKQVFESGGDRIVEIWNHVFMQYFEEAPGKMTPLPKPSVDTGAGLERLSAVLQGVSNNYDTDLFLPLIERACKLAGLSFADYVSHKMPEEQKSALRVMADHARSATFLIGDGAIPSNEGRGYVLRRILRRGIRYGRKLSDQVSFLPELCQTVITHMQVAYPELEKQKSLIISTIKIEEERFLQTLDQGTHILQQTLQELRMQKAKKIPGDIVFRLYDTFGFPLDLTRIMAEEQGFTVDEAEFEQQMERARKKAKASWKGATITADAAHLIQLSQNKKATFFNGYQELHAKSKVTDLSDGKTKVTQLSQGQHGILISELTPFYAESGGQVGDHGTAHTASAKINILDCKKQNDIHLHFVEILEGTLKINDAIELQVESSLRRQTACNHSATHLLHAALRKVLGDTVSQAGSLVEPARLRFDFTHSQSMSSEQIQKVEELVNAEISLAQEVTQQSMDYKSAIHAGAMALFGEKYGDEVRVIKMGNFSTELCGGIHVGNTAWIRMFKIVSEGGVSSGIRRIEAITGNMAQEYLMKNTLENLESRKAVGIAISWDKYLGLEEEKTHDAKTKASSAKEFIESLRQQIKDLEKELKSSRSSQINYDQLISQAHDVGYAKVITMEMDIEDREVLSDVWDRLRDRMETGLVVLVGRGEKTHPILVGATKNLAGKVNAGQILKQIAGEMGGSGGGRPDFAQGAAPDRSKAAAAFQKLLVSLKSN